MSYNHSSSYSNFERKLKRLEISGNLEQEFSKLSAITTGNKLGSKTEIISRINEEAAALTEYGMKIVASKCLGRSVGSE